MNLKNLLTPFKALSYPILPIVPACTYCSAMRFGMIGCIFTGLGTGFAFHHILLGISIGIIYSILLVGLLWFDYKIHH